MANAYKHRDLYWALRGGGGGTFGVVVEVTLKTFPEPPVIVQNFNVTFPDVTSLWSFAEKYLAALPGLDDAGGSGYYYFDPVGVILQNGKPTFVGLHFFFNKTNTDVVNGVFEPLFNFAHSINGTHLVNITFAFPQARVVYPQRGGSDGTGSNVIIGTRLYSRDTLLTSSGPQSFASALSNITSIYPTIIQGHLTAGGQVARNSHIDSALNPSWRKALGELIVPVIWMDSTPAEVQAELATGLTNTLMPILAAVDPSMGAYTNEANPYEPEWQTVFWGTNYPRLLKVKHRWDPCGLFRCNRCVGSERWDSTGNCPAL